MKPQDQLDINELLKEERNISNESYAPIIVKTIVYGFIGMICIAFVSYLITMVWRT